MSDCQQKLREAGKPYPRTCERCGLGPCIRPQDADLPAKDDEIANLKRQHALEILAVSSREIELQAEIARLRSALNKCADILCKEGDISTGRYLVTT